MPLQREDHTAAVAVMAQQQWWHRLVEHCSERVPPDDAAALTAAAEALTAAGRAIDAEAVLRRLHDKTARAYASAAAFSIFACRAASSLVVVSASCQCE